MDNEEIRKQTYHKKTVNEARTLLTPLTVKNKKYPVTLYNFRTFTHHKAKRIPMATNVKNAAPFPSLEREGDHRRWWKVESSM